MYNFFRNKIKKIFKVMYVQYRKIVIQFTQENRDGLQFRHVEKLIIKNFVY